MICPSLFITYIIIVHDKRHDVYVLTSDYGRLVCHSEGLLFPKQMVSFEKISRWRWGYFKSLESSLSQAVGLSPPGPNPSVCLCWKGQEKREAPLILSTVSYICTYHTIDSSRRGGVIERRREERCVVVVEEVWASEIWCEKGIRNPTFSCFWLVVIHPFILLLDDARFLSTEEHSHSLALRERHSILSSPPTCSSQQLYHIIHSNHQTK